MITTVTLNTSIDRRYSIRDFNKDGIFRSDNYQATAGGKGINVTKVIKDLGESVIATGFIGGNNGQYIKEQLDGMYINNDFVKIKEETRNCIAILCGSGSQTEILEAGPEVSAEEVDIFTNKFMELCSNSAVITISGSLPRGVPTYFYRRLLQLADEKNVRVILDTSGEPMKQALTGKLPILIKPNEEELEAVINKSLTCEGDIISAGKTLLAKGIEYVVISRGKNGAMMFNKDVLFKASIPEIKAVNPVGSGDSMVAGFAVAIQRGYKAEEMIAFAAACGTANAMEEKTGKVTLENVDRIINNIKVEKIYL